MRVKSLLVALGLATIMCFCLGATKTLAPLKSDGTSDPETLVFTADLLGGSASDTIVADCMTLISSAAFGCRPIYSVRRPGAPSSIYYSPATTFTPTDSLEVAAAESWTICGRFIGVILYGQSATVQVVGWQGEF